LNEKLKAQRQQADKLKAKLESEKKAKKDAQRKTKRLRRQLKRKPKHAGPSAEEKEREHQRRKAAEAAERDSAMRNSLRAHKHKRDAKRRARHGKKQAEDDEAARRLKRKLELAAYHKQSEPWYARTQRESGRRQRKQRSADDDADRRRSHAQRAADDQAIRDWDASQRALRRKNRSGAENKMRAYFDTIRDKDAWIWEVVDTVSPPPPSRYTFRTLHPDGRVSKPRIHSKLPVPKAITAANINEGKEDD